MGRAGRKKNTGIARCGADSRVVVKVLIHVTKSEVR
jgi:hypothetical protein